MTAKMHRMHLAKVGEGVVYVPGGVPFEADPIPKYPPGSYMRLGNKEYIYAIAGGSLIPDVGAMNSLTQTVAQRAIVIPSAGVIPAGSTQISITITATQSIAENALAGGEIVVFPAPSNKAFTRGIVSNTAVVTSGTLVVVLDSPTPVAITSGSAECMANPYSAVTESAGEWAMVMGMPTVIATIGQGLWLQVSGPSWCAPAAGVGNAEKDLEAVFVGNGSIALRDSTTNLHCQHAGVVICTATGTGQGAPFLMLQIAH